MRMLVSVEFADAGTMTGKFPVSVVGGLLGGVIGAVVAKNTGTEVELPAGSTLTIALGAPIEIRPQ